MDKGSTETLKLSEEEQEKIMDLGSGGDNNEHNRAIADEIARSAAHNIKEAEASSQPGSAVSESDAQRLNQAAVPIKSHDMMNLAQLAKKRRPMSTSAFFFTRLALFIPVINILLVFIWAFRRKTNQNRQAYARSILIWVMVWVLVAVVTLMALLSLGFDFNYMYSRILEAYSLISTM